MTMSQEILIYGLRAGETREYMEEILYSKAQTVGEANKIMDILAKDHGCTKMRVWTFNGQRPDFAAAVAV